MQNSELKEIFDKIILPEAQRILNEHSGLFLITEAYELFSFEYCALHKYYSQKYMHPNSNGLDTHKEISTIIIALLKTKIIKTVDPSYYESVMFSKHAFNEELAFCVGCHIIKSVMSCDYQSEDNDLSEDERNFSCNEIKRNLLLPKTTYQDYKTNVITEFYYTSREGSFNFLGLADKFFWIEYFNKRKIKEKYNKSQI